MPREKSIPVRSARPSRGAAQVSKAINDALLGTKKNIGPASLGRPVPTGGLLSQSKLVTVKKNGKVLRKMTVRRKAYFPGRRRKIY